MGNGDTCGFESFAFGDIDNFDNVLRTLAKSEKLYNIDGSKRSQSFSIPNVKDNAERNSRMFFKQRNCAR